MLSQLNGLLPRAVRGRACRRSADHRRKLCVGAPGGERQVQRAQPLVVDRPCQSEVQLSPLGGP